MAPQQVYGKRPRIRKARLPVDDSVAFAVDTALDNVTTSISRLGLHEEKAPESDRPVLASISDNKKKPATRKRSDGRKTVSQAHTDSSRCEAKGTHTTAPAAGSDASSPEILRQTSSADTAPKRTKVPRESVYADQTDPSRTKTTKKTLPSTDHAQDQPPAEPPQPLQNTSNLIPPPLQPDLPPNTAAHIAPLLPYLTTPLTPFTSFSTTLSPHFNITKIAEASFSQVFLLSSPSLPSSTRSVLKLIPLLPPLRTITARPTKAQRCLLDLSSSPGAVVSEVRLLSTLTSVPGFTTFRALHLLSGRPGQAFVQACRAWNKVEKEQGREGSWFPDPGRKGNYGEGQLWAVVEMGDAGMDLERLLMREERGEGETEKVEKRRGVLGYGIMGIWDVFWQVVLAAGKGEVACKWESRDLHCGNICVKERGGGSDKESRKELAARMAKDERKGRRRKLGLTGLEVTIIDYTISRAEVVNELGKKEVAFIDLAEDESLFLGDGSVEYQYDIYRYMRAAAFLDDPLADVDARWNEIEGSGDTWKDFHPETNVVWLHFVLFKLLENCQWSAMDDADDNFEHGLFVQREQEVEAILRKLHDLLKLENWAASGIRSAEDLVTMALKEQWLDVDDVLGLLDEKGDRTKSKQAQSKKKKVTTSQS
ncbi:hypothetical protein CAC42_1791 [Sphaceloma murrayae]|uniref:non-specific serine/threonine protein kinase n=1 Tax=Sphaceloma murrayae TaxID=2082308 RepID=A0A2K1QVH3_9PEZI|nr:hypothetical protein CAC42_1791 [Sphaceloma murrayae]